MSQRFLLSVAALALASFTAVSAGCSSDDRPAIISGGSGPAPGGGTGGVGDGSAPGPTPGDDGGAGGDLCDPDVAAGESAGVSEITIVADTPPNPLGGELVPGTYVLTEVSRFAPGGGTQNDEDGGGSGPPASNTLASKTLVIEGNTYRFTERTGTVDTGVSDTPVLTGGTFEIAGTSITLAQSCPQASSQTIGFSAVGGSISIYPTSDRRETYVIQ